MLPRTLPVTITLSGTDVTAAATAAATHQFPEDNLTKSKNHRNPVVFDRVIKKIKGKVFFETQCINK